MPTETIDTNNTSTTTTVDLVKDTSESPKELEKEVEKETTSEPLKETPVEETAVTEIAVAVAIEEEKPVEEEEKKEESTTESTIEKKDTKMSEGVEVILDAGSGSTIVDQDQNVFRAPHPVRPRAMRAHPHDVKGSGSYGYGGPSDYHNQSPYPYAPSASFDEGGYPPMTASHYSPHVQYPHPTRHGGDVNVISPNHKEHQTSGQRPPMTPRGRGGHHSSYQYPPSSPVSRPNGHHSPPRMRGYHMRRPDTGAAPGHGPYAMAQRSRSHPPTRHHEEDAWGYSPEQRPRPPIVAEASFDSEHYPASSHPSNPTTPNAPHYGPPMHHDGYHHHQQQGFQGGSFGSFESPAPGYYEQRGHYGRPSPHYPESPYTPYSHGYPGYSPGGAGYPRDYYSPHPDYHRRYAHSYEDEYGHSKKNDGMMLPKAAQEIDFEVTDPPMEPIVQPSKTPICESPADVNTYDVLCGRGGGTNSQIGNRRFRKLVQEFQPTYLLARRKEKPLLARTIVLIIRKRGGRFLKKDDETGELYEVGDAKAEAKTSQALREGLDVRATKSAASNLMDKKKKKKKSSSATSPKPEEEKESTMSPASQVNSPVGVAEIKENGRKSPEAAAPPSLPTLNQDQPPVPPAPPSPNSVHFRKRRRMRSGDASVGAGAGCGMGFQDKLFPDFCPPRADLGRVASPTMEMAMDMSRHEMKYADDDIYAAGAPPPHHHQQRPGCGVFDIVTGAAASGFCMAPRKWR